MSFATGLGPRAWRRAVVSAAPAPLWSWSAPVWHSSHNNLRGFTSAMPRQARRDPTRLKMLGLSPSPATQQAASVEGVGAFIIPGTMVPPSILRSLRSRPAEGARLQWARFVGRLRDAAGIVALWFSSKAGLFKPARLRVNRRTILPTAKALHRAMSGALAAGDRETLRRVCVPRLYNELVARVARRPRGRRYGWSLLGYSRPLLYPRIVDHKVLTLPGPSGRAAIIHQAVVAISSRQRLVQYSDDSDGLVPVPGSEKEQDLVENLVLCRPIDPNTFRPGDWSIFGHLEETTYQAWQEDVRGLAQLEEQHRMR